MRFATYSAAGKTHYGAVADTGMIAPDSEFAKWPTLLDAVQAGGLSELEDAARGKAVTHEDFHFEMVLPNRLASYVWGSIFQIVTRNTKIAAYNRGTCHSFRVLPADSPDMSAR